MIETMHEVYNFFDASLGSFGFRFHPFIAQIKFFKVVVTFWPTFISEGIERILK